jgi:hypothetical protein
MQVGTMQVGTMQVGTNQPLDRVRMQTICLNNLYTYITSITLRARHRLSTPTGNM